MRILLAISLLAAACSSSPRNSNGDDTGACTGSETRCDGTAFQTCNGGMFENTASCPDACSPTLGCVQCDPAASGGNTCMANNVVTCQADGTYGGVVTACSAAQMCLDGACSSACTADGVNLVYAVDEMNNFLSFDPRLLPGNPFVKIGTLSCPHASTSIQSPPGAVMPFSMSVDRDGKAWVEYTSGEIFNVSITDASCTASGYVAQAGGMALFGMGFVTDAANSDEEKLYIAGGGHAAEPNGRLARVDTHAMNYAPQQLGTISAPSDFSAELTGTNTAQLYGFFPVIDGTPAYVQEIDKTNGAPIGQRFNLGALATVRDWAFAQWGGKFYIFTTTDDGFGDLTSTVKSIDKATGAVVTEIASSMYQVDGAGVSTCAPSVIQ